MKRPALGRVRTVRPFASNLYVRDGSTHLPIRITKYPAPPMYWTFLRHRRKRDLDVGVMKLRNGLYRSRYFNEVRDDRTARA